MFISYIWCFVVHQSLKSLLIGKKNLLYILNIFATKLVMDFDAEVMNYEDLGNSLLMFHTINI